jgi:signal transduction histidine kinase
MNHISANYLPLVVRKQLGLYCFIEPDVPQLMSGDPMRLQQVISNLLSNAIKFTDTGCIILHVQCAGDYLQISVRDTGEGSRRKRWCACLTRSSRWGPACSATSRAPDWGWRFVKS